VEDSGAVLALASVGAGHSRGGLARGNSSPALVESAAIADALSTSLVPSFSTGDVEGEPLQFNKNGRARAPRRLKLAICECVMTFTNFLLPVLQAKGHLAETERPDEPCDAPIIRDFAARPFSPVSVPHAAAAACKSAWDF
jgi:hypothetical protein